MPILVWFALSLAGSAALAADGGGCAAPAETFSVALPRIEVGPAEHVVGFELALAGSDVVAIGRIPRGWSVKLNTEASTRKVSGTVERGGEELSTAEALPTFNVAVNPTAAGHSAFDLQAVVYTSTDPKTYVKHAVPCSDLLRSARTAGPGPDRAR